MRPTISIATFYLSILAGCENPRPEPPPGPDHPASPAAAASPLTQPSQTLTINLSERPDGSGDRGAMSTMPALATAPAGAVLYACPMHPEMTSTNPNDRCPKCNMKINKPVKAAATRPATQPTEAHQHDHAGGGHK